MQNGIYSGLVIHNRLIPKRHFFKYNITMFLLDVDNVEKSFEGIPFVSVNKFNLLSFYRKNYMPSTAGLSIRDEVVGQIHEHGFKDVPCKIYILTHLAYLGYCYNPVSFYFCYSKEDELIYFLAEVNNTPWNERYVYLQKLQNHDSNIKFDLQKKFHVSPFLPMDMIYKWTISNPQQTVKVSMQCYENNLLTFTASFRLSMANLTVKNCLKALFKNPIATQLLHYRIYWQALKLFIKRNPFYAHPNRN